MWMTATIESDTSLLFEAHFNLDVDVDVAECEAKDLLHVEVQDVTAYIIGVNTVVSSSFNVEYDIKLDASKDQVEDAKVEDYQVDESEVDDVVVSEPQVDEANVDDT
ncbi:hypothetical protein Tco_0988361 [Tanacetum coccineum]|uniref:Uncharacterized protein n=1 Tax=Tanacetum coccineum TaxID=301880 RepID=A0ABQ5ES34_9ASTR